MPDTLKDACRVGQSQWIDAHVHIWSPDTNKYPLAHGYCLRDMQPSSFTAEELFQVASALGVAQIVLIQMVFYGCDNSYMLNAIHRNPDKFAGVALVNDQSDYVAAELRRLRLLNVRGIRISPTADAKANLSNN